VFQTHSCHVSDWTIHYGGLHVRYYSGGQGASITAAKFAETERKYENMTWFLNMIKAKFKIHYT
jgi:hypothetical protein